MNTIEFLNCYRSGQRDFRGVDLQDVKLDHVILNDGLDLSEANLSRAVIYKADMSGAKLYRAILHNAELSEVNLSEACLQEANLSDSFLSEVGLSYSDLRSVDLSKVGAFEICLFAADLSNANLACAELSGDLRRSNLTRANMAGAYLGYVDLSLATLLETNIELAEFGEEVLLSGATMADGSIYD